jgi:hypothetical protein
VDGRLVGWIADAVERRIMPYPPELALEPTGSMARARAGHTAVALSGGRALVTGGWDGWRRPDEPDGCGVGCDRMNHIVELYDPKSGSFSALPDGMITTRQHHSATTLADGRVLLAGGQDAAGNVLGASELFDPASGTFSTGASLHVPREDHVAVTLDDGRVVLLGGIVDASGSPTTPVPETYDPVTDTWTQGLSDDLLADTAAAVALPGGDVLVLEAVVDVSPDAVDSRGIARYVPESGAVRVTPSVLGDGLEGAVFGTTRGATLGTDGRVVVAIRDERNSQAWAGDDSGVYAIQPTTGVVSLVAGGIGRPVLGPVSLSDGRLVVLTDAPGACGPVTIWVLDDATGDATSLGEVPGIGTCNGLPGSTLTALPGDSLLIAGGNSSGGVTTAAAALIHPIASRP